MAHIRKAETLIGYMDADNPSGFGLCFEIGYAHSLGKHIIFIDETDEKRRRYFGMVRAVAHEVYKSIDDSLQGVQQ